MKNKLKVISLLTFSFFFFAACTTVQYAETNIIPEAKNDQALVVFYREKNFVGSAISYYIKLDDAQIGALRNGTYFFKYFEPGEYTFTATTEVTRTVDIKAEAGKVYYIQGSVVMGAMAGRPKLTLVSEQEGKNAIPSLKMIATNQ